MKFRIFAAFLSVLLMMTLFTGCALSAVDERLDHVEDAVENRVELLEDVVDDRLTTAKEPAEYPEFRIYTIDLNVTNAPVEEVIPEEPVPMVQTPNAAAPLTKREAEAIAQQNAGFDANQVSFLYTKYEVDDGIPQYNVQFKESGVEYEFEIHAETGEILSFEKGD